MEVRYKIQRAPNLLREGKAVQMWEAFVYPEDKYAMPSVNYPEKTVDGYGDDKLWRSLGYFESRQQALFYIQPIEEKPTYYDEEGTLIDEDNE